MQTTPKANNILGHFFALLGAVVMLAIATWVSASTSEQVTLLDNLAVPRTGHTATALSDGRILITGGRDADGTLVAASEIFDPETQTSSASATLNTARVDHSATVLVDGRVLVAGGTGASGALSSAEIFDPAHPENGFTTAGSTMSAARTRHTATLLNDGHVLIAGGDTQGTAELFDPTTGTFSPQLWNLTVARSGHTATLFSDDSVLLAGGNTSTMEKYTPGSGFTLDPATMSVVRTGHWAFELSDTRLLLFQGDTGNSIDEFNPGTGTITPKGSLDFHASSSSLLANGKVLVLGTDIAGLYDPNAVPPAPDFTAFDEQSVEHSGILPRSGQAAVQLPGDKKILISGGVDGNNQLLGQALFNPARIWTDKDDYQPDEPVILSASGWKANETIYLFAVDNETEQWTYEMTVNADANGEFVLSPYFIVELRHLGVQFHVTAVGQSTMQADVYFTDSNPSNLSVGTQTPNPVSAGSSASYTVTATGGGTGTNCPLDLILAWTGPAPVGTTDNFSPNPMTTTNGNGSSTLTINTTNTGPMAGRTQPGTYNFTVTAARGANCQGNGNLTATGTLVVGGGTAATTTTVASSLNPSTYGSPVTFTSTVTSTTTPTGSVNFNIAGIGTVAGTAGATTATTATWTYTTTATALTAGNHTVSASFTGTGSFGNSTGNLTGGQNVSPKALAITATTVSKTYGDTYVPDTTPPSPDFTVSGLVGSDSVTSIVLNSTGYASTAPVSGSPYIVTPSGAVGTGLSNYGITYNNGTITLAKKTASVTPNAASKTYGAADPALTGTLSGFLAADGVTATYSRTGGETVAGSPYTISATLSPAGVLGNYNITFNTANFTITAKAASVTPNAASKTYGAADPAFTGTLSGFLPADGVTATYSRTAGESVAGNPYTISATLSPAAVLGNYAITYNTASFTIDPKAASVTPNAASKTYGAADPAFTGTLSGFLAADGVTATYSRTAGESVAGNPYTISATLSPAAVLGNYAITYNTANFTIDAKAASVTPNAASKTYGAADPAFTGTLSGFLAADGVTATYSRTAGESVAGNPYTISATLSPAAVLGNYNITYNTASFTIDPKAASVTPNAASKTYGAADPAFTGTLSGFLAADGVTATYSRTAGETVLGSPYTISATLSPAAVLGNYAITYNTANFTIDPKAASVTPNAASKTYGAADPAVTGTLSGFLAADGVTATYSRTAGETVLGSPYTISAALSPAGVLSNYAITYNTANFTIDPKAASVTPNAASKIYGAADPAFSGTLSGFLAADGVTATYSRTAGETVLGSPYTISAALSPAGVLSNYAITYNTANFTIDPKAASVTPNAASKIYGAADPAFSGTLSGFLAADGVTATYSRTAGETVLGSPYTISAVLSPAGVLSNYSITYNTAIFTIDPKAASVTPNAASKTYGAADPAFTGTLSGFLAADGVTATYSRTAGETVLGGPYTISATLSPAGVLTNYSITYNTASFTINLRNATWTTNANSKTYGDSDPVPVTTGSGSNFVDPVTATYARLTGETVTGGPYHITATLNAAAGVLDNYNINNAGADFIIDPKAASVTPNAASKTYGAADPAFTGTLSGFLAADGVTATYSRTAGETVLGGPYTISATLSPAGVLSNYAITYNTANFTIDPKTASVTPNAASKIYGAADPAFTGTLSGFLAADGVTATYSRTAGETVLGGPYTISATLSPAGMLSNYSITYNTADFAIDPKAASVTPNVASKTYGDADLAFTGTLSGFVAADGVTATYSRTTGESVAGSPYTISATVSPVGVLSNYSITYNTASFTINLRNATWTTNPNSKTYGSADPVPVTTGSGTNFVDPVTATYARVAGETVAGGPYHITATLSAGAGVLANYSITNAGANFTITPKAASVSPNPASKVYGSADPAFTGSLSGFLVADGVTATYSRSAGETVLGSPYTISATLSPVGVLSNYSITYNTANFTITPKPATWTTNPNSKVFGASDPNPLTTGSGSGFLAADAPLITATYSRVAGESASPPTYHITATLSPAGVLSNYSVANNGAEFTISHWTTGGFYQPVDMNGVVNTVKGGSTVPMKFNIYAGNVERTSVSDVQGQTLQVIEYSCQSGVEDPIGDLPNTGATALRYDTTGHQFIQNWATPKAPNKCYRVRMTAIDGSVIEALFKTK